MQYSELKKVLKGRLARFSASTRLDTYIVSELNAMIGELEEEGFLPWFLEKEGDITLDPGYTEVNLPEDFLAERLADSEDLTTCFLRYKVQGVPGWYKSQVLLKDPNSDPDVYQPTLVTGPPDHYYCDHQRNKISFTAVADVEYRIAYDYYKKGNRYFEETPDDYEPEWAKYAPGYLIAVTGMRIAAMYIKNTEAAQVFFADAQRERTKLIHRHTAVHEARINPNTEN